MEKTEEKKIDYSVLPKLDHLYEEDIDRYPLGCCLAIAVRLLSDDENEKLFFDLGDEA